MTDTYRLKGLRQQLVRELKTKGIQDIRILQAFEEIPRHYFLDKAFAEWAYKDVPFPIEADQTISQPYTVAFQTQLLDIRKGDRVLEVGTGSGFQASVLAYIGARVYTIERQEKLFHQTKMLLENIGFPQVRTLFGDGYEGAPRYAPYDKILITAGAQHIPQTLVEQLVPGGVMVIPLGDENEQIMKRYTKNENNTLFEESFDRFRFVPFLKGIQQVSGAPTKPVQTVNRLKVSL